MSKIYIDLAEHTKHPERAVLLAIEHDASKVVFIGENQKLVAFAGAQGIESEWLPAGSTVPAGCPRIFCGMLATGY